MVLLAVIVRLIFLYFTLKGYQTDAKLKGVSNQILGIEKDNNLDSREKRHQITSLMRSNGINPLVEIYSVIGQLAFIGILYQIVQYGIHPEGFKQLYSFIPNPGQVNTIFFGFDVSRPSFLLSALAGGILFVEQLWEYEDKKDIPEATFSSKWYPLLLPIGTFILLVFLPATKAVFVITSIIFSLGIRLMITLGRGKPEST